jgi:RNA polymerase-binding transcription factor DksA
MPVHLNALKARTRLEQERDRLIAIRDALSGEPVDGLSERDALSELSVGDQHPADLGTEMFERAKDMSILDRINAALTDVERAIRRLDSGAYGVCEACGREIPAERLEAKPEARFCVADQARAEREALAS